MQFIVTLITNPETSPLEEKEINRVFKEIEKYQGKVQDFSWLSTNEAVDIIFQSEEERDWAAIIKAVVQDYSTDVVVQPYADKVSRRKRFLISDMDSTIIQQECIDELADVMGLKEKVSAITERAMNGELDFPASLRERVALLKDLPEVALQEVFDTRIELMPGARTLVATMKKAGATCVLVSGGFTFFTERVQKMTGFDATHANQLTFVEGKLTGQVVEPILDKDSKLASLKAYQAQLQLQQDHILAVGDGANDLPMLQAAGMGIAYRAKPHVQEQTSCAVDYGDLTALLFIQGYHRDEFIEG